MSWINEEGRCSNCHSQLGEPALPVSEPDKAECSASPPESGARLRWERLGIRSARFGDADAAGAQQFERVRAAARVLCQVTCSAYPCRTCSPSSSTWMLAERAVAAADSVEREEINNARR